MGEEVLRAILYIERWIRLLNNCVHEKFVLRRWVRNCVDLYKCGVKTCDLRGEHSCMGDKTESKNTYPLCLDGHQ